MRDGGSDIYRLYVDRDLFVYGYINSKTNRFSTYIIDCYTSQLQELLEHLEHLNSQVCFNGINIEYQILDDIITSREVYCGAIPSVQLEMINRKSFHIRAKDIPLITEKDFYIPQIDLSKLLGLNTAIRNTKISDVAYMFNHDYPDNGDMICDNIGKQFKQQFNKDDIMKYIESSVFSIKSLCIYSSESVKTRKEISSDFKTKLTLNMSDVKAGEVLLCRLYCKSNNIDLKSFPKPSIKLNENIDCNIFNDLRFNSEIFNGYSAYLKSLKLDKDTSISYKIILNNIAINFGNGGIHGCCSSGIYEPKSDESIIICDITSFYASIICKYNLHPSHLNESFIDCYKSILERRFDSIESSNESKSKMLKNMLVGIFGKFKEQQSNLYDITLQSKVTAVSQLFMCWWIDKLLSNKEICLLGVNTDGIIMKVKNSSIEYVECITRLIENTLDTKVKSSFINKLFLKDINNYMYISKECKIIKVGCFDNSFSIYKSRNSIMTADVILKYFLNDIKNADTFRLTYGDNVVKSAFKIIYSIIEQQQTLF